MDNNYVKIQIEGKKVNNYLKWLIKQKINIINLNEIKKNQIELIIAYNDLKKIQLYSKTYKIKIIKKYGKLKLIEHLKKKSYIYISLIISILFLYFLTHVTFSVDVIYNNPKINSIIKKELKKYGVEKYKFKKNYSYIKEIKEKILKDNKDILEWIEIIEDGTKYVVKIVERKKPLENKEFKYQSITATKDAIITKIKATSGEKLKEKNDYVKKGEVIVSGILTKPDGNLIYKKANATIYGEVWYKISVEYPYAYYEEKITGRNKDVYVINFLDKKLPILTYQKYKEFKIESNNIILENNILPINLSKEKQYEVVVKEKIYTIEEVISNAIETSKKKLQESNARIINIKKVEILDKTTIGSKIKLDLFISAEEDITKVMEIKINEN